MRFVNPAGGTSQLPGSNVNLKLRLYYPEHGKIQPLDSEAVTLDAGSVADGTSVDKVFMFGTTDRFIPWGVRAVDVVDAGGGEYVENKNNPQVVALHPHIRTPLTITWLLE